jgi:hypothetical protein
MGRPANIIGIMGKKQGYLPLTTAWIAATGETNTTILNALNTFESGLIANSLTGKFFALYPFVGGDATKHSYNFINTGAFQLSFSGGWTHSANGADPNGTNAFANTGLTPSTTLSLNNTHLSVYLRENTNTGVDIGCAIAATSNTSILARNVSNIAVGNCNQLTNSTVSNTDSRGYFLTSRTGASTIDLYRNGSSILASTVASTSRPTNPIYLGARRLDAGVDSYSARQLAFASIGSGLTSGEQSTLYTLVQAFQTSLIPSRNV